MSNDDILTEAIRLIKAGRREEARSLLEPLLVKNPNHIQAWMWEAELFPEDDDKIRVLEACLKRNPGQAQVMQALTFLRKRRDARQVPAAPVSPPRSFPASPPVKSTVSSASYFRPYGEYEPVVPIIEPEPPPADPPAAAIPTRSEPPVPQRAKPQRPAKRLTPAVMQTLGMLMACIALVAVIGLYLGGGAYLNSQINSAFAVQNCPAVVEHAAFVSVYPEAIFASMFTGHEQYGECRTKLDMERALVAKNWASALSSAQHYLATYPGGVFTESIRAQAPEILFSWSEQSIASHDYGSGIDQLKQLVEGYPESPRAQPAPETILQSYLLWTEDLAARQGYAEAEQHLSGALTFFQADPARAEQIKLRLGSLYVEWGDMQIKVGDTENGIKHYEMAAQLSPGLVDVDLLIARADLQKAIDLAGTGNFDAALVRVAEIAAATQAENVKVEADAAREQILAEYSASTSQQAIDQMTAAITTTCQGQPPELPIFGRDAEKVGFGLLYLGIQLPAERAAETPGELHYVVCIDDSAEELETCRYTGNFYLVRARHRWQVTVYDTPTGDEAGSKTFRGSAPASCPPRANFRIGSTTSISYGSLPSVDEILAWLDLVAAGE